MQHTLPTTVPQQNQQVQPHPDMYSANAPVSMLHSIHEISLKGTQDVPPARTIRHKLGGLAASPLTHTPVFMTS